MTPMQLGTETEIQIFTVAVTAGVFLGIIYGLFKLVRRAIPVKAVCFICDLVYALMFGAVFFVFSLAQTNYIRGFLLAGMLAGAAMWHFTFGRLFIFIISAVGRFLSDKIIAPIFKLMHKILAGIGKPFVKFAQILKNKKIYVKST